MNNNPHKKYKRPKQKTQATTNPDPPKPLNHRDDGRSECPEQVCPLQAKDSEWVDILQSPFPDAPTPSSSNVVGDDEAVECEDGPQMKPLAIMFPGLLERDPQTLEGMLTKAMSTTEVTRHLVDLGEKANFTFMKRANRLIPRDKQWLESLAETSNSHCSLDSSFFDSTSSSDYTADGENVEDDARKIRRRKKLFVAREPPLGKGSSTTRENSSHNAIHNGNQVATNLYILDEKHLNSEKPVDTIKAWKTKN
ncbi:uncharacterized protein LOC126368575 isoform X2 [Pectinophora gossypiella]|uniref:uncharacterized protein LOC126368575 isoform X2 n=1 Tax=Pectinophora gossypiella TaxID=13191 RepID=UPI00214EA421|nr:uncharacterized protein LOC126368575 isoform X2 [Pectinophora gossypiella]